MQNVCPVVFHLDQVPAGLYGYSPFTIKSLSGNIRLMKTKSRCWSPVFFC